MLRSAFLLLSGNAAASALLLGRNLLVARLIPVADYGVAATLAIVMAVVEMASALGLQHQIVQAKDGDDPAFQTALQGFQVLRGCLAGAALFLLAGPLAALMRVPEAAWGYRVLAVVPVLNALVHFDVYRLGRHMVFWPQVLSGSGAALAALLAVWPLAAALGDWRVMLWSIVIQFALATLVSHLMAERPYRLALDRAVIARSLGFGWPILVNGALMFLVFNGDRVIVSRFLGVETLAIFAMGVTLTLTPMLVLSMSLRNLFLPVLSAAPDDDAFAHLAAVAIQATLLLGFLVVAVVTLAGGPVVLVLLGERYAGLLPILTLMAVVQAVRLFRMGPAVVTLARGHTAYDMLGNIARILSLPAAAAVAASTGNLMDVLWVGLLGEAAGLAVVLAVLPRTLPPRAPAGARPEADAGVPLGPIEGSRGLRGLAGPFAAAGLGLALATVYALSAQQGGASGGAAFWSVPWPDAWPAPRIAFWVASWPTAWIGGAFLLALALMAWSMGDLRRAVLQRRRPLT